MGHTQQLARGMFWLGSATVAARLIDAASSIVVLRALTSAQLGLATLALTVTAFVEGFNSLGINNVLIQRAKVSAEEVSSVWWYVLCVATLMTGGMMLCAPLLARLYGADELAELVRLASIKLFFVGLASVPLALLNRSLKFKELGAIMAGATVLSAGITLALALSGAGAWAPLVGNTAHGVFQFLGTCVFGFYRPRAGFAWARVASMARDGVQVAGAVSIGQLTRNVDYLILGKMVGLGLLGTYRVAFDLAMVPSVIVLQIVNRASLPIYSRIAGEGGDLSPAFARTLRVIALLLIPLLLIAALGGETLVELLNKAHAGDIRVVIACLCAAAWLRGLSQCTPVLLIASGRPARALVQAASSAGLLSLGILVGLAAWPERDPLLVTACAWIVCTALQLGVDFWLTRRSVALSGAALLNATLIPAGAALVTGGGVLAIHQLVSVETPGVALAIDAVAIVGLFALVLRYGLKIRGLQELRPRPASATVASATMTEDTRPDGTSP